MNAKSRNSRNQAIDSEPVAPIRVIFELDGVVWKPTFELPDGAVLGIIDISRLRRAFDVAVSQFKRTQSRDLALMASQSKETVHV